MLFDDGNDARAARAALSAQDEPVKDAWELVREYIELADTNADYGISKRRALELFDRLSASEKVSCAYGEGRADLLDEQAREAERERKALGPLELAALDCVDRILEAPAPEKDERE